MGVVIRQSFWATVIAYMGVVIGYFNTLYLRPEFLTLSEIGIFNLVTANAMLISPFCSAGMPGTFIKYFPLIDKSRAVRNQFFTFQAVVIISLNILVIALAYLNQNWIASHFEENASGYINYLGITAIIIVVNSLFELMFAYCRSLLNVVIPSLLRDVFLRLGSILLIAGFAFKWWDYEMAVTGLALNYSLALLVLFLYLMIGHGLRFTTNLSYIDEGWRKKIFKYGSYAMLLGLSFAVMNNVNYLQVSTELGEAATGIFTTCFFIGIIVEMPRRNMLKVLSPIFSKAMQARDMEQVNRMYQKGSITMSVFGLLLVIGILTNVEDLFAFIPQGSGFAAGYWVVVAVCFAKLIIILFSFSQEIIVFSDFYRYSLYLQIGAAIVLILLNIWLLPILGLTGAGISYLGAITLQTLFKFGLLWERFKISPFTKAHWTLAAISIGVFLIFFFIPLSFGPVINIGLRAVLTTVLFMGLVWKMNVSPDINQLIKTTFEKIRF